MNSVEQKGSVPKTTLSGTGNTFANSSLSMSNNGGLHVSGDHNTVENVLIEHTDWLGTLTYVPLELTGACSQGVPGSFFPSILPPADFFCGCPEPVLSNHGCSQKL